MRPHWYRRVSKGKHNGRLWLPWFRKWSRKHNHTDPKKSRLFHCSLSHGEQYLMTTNGLSVSAGLLLFPGSEFWTEKSKQRWNYLVRNCTSLNKENVESTVQNCILCMLNVHPYQQPRRHFTGCSMFCHKLEFQSYWTWKIIVFSLKCSSKINSKSLSQD